MTSFDAVRHLCRYAVRAGLAGNHERREQMRGQLFSGDLPPEWAGWVEGARGDPPPIEWAVLVEGER